MTEKERLEEQKNLNERRQRVIDFVMKEWDHDAADFALLVRSRSKNKIEWHSFDPGSILPLINEGHDTILLASIINLLTNIGPVI